MRKTAILASMVFLAAVLIIFKKKGILMTGSNEVISGIISLPKPKLDGKVSVEKALSVRRSIRSYKNEPITIEQLSQLFWSAQGITDNQGLRTAPSAGALYPVEIYVVVGDVKDLPSGIYKYDYNNHTLTQAQTGDHRSALSSAALGQSSVEDGAIDFIITGIYERTSSKYGSRAERYVHLEVGHVAQNIYLQAVCLGLGTVVIGAFDDEQVKKVIGAQDDERPLYIMPVGISLRI